MDYKQILEISKGDTDGLLKSKQGEQDSEQLRRQKIDNLLRTYVNNSDMLSFLSAREESVALAYDPEKVPGWRSTILSLNGNGTLTVHVYGDNEYPSHYGLADVTNPDLRVNSDHKEWYADFIEEDNLAFVCRSSVWLSTKPGDLLTGRYSDSDLKNVTAEQIESNLYAGLEQIAKKGN